MIRPPEGNIAYYDPRGGNCMIRSRVEGPCGVGIDPAEGGALHRIIPGGWGGGGRQGKECLICLHAHMLTC
jgi:hypothetical protein